MTHRILIVEDDKHFAAQLKELFDYHGLHARVATTGPEGIQAFGDGGADFVLVDVMLPQVHGLKVLERIRELPGGADVPTVLMSAVYKKESLFAVDLARLGVHGFLPKPFSLIDLGRKVNGILAEPEGGRASVRELLAKEGPPAPPARDAAAPPAPTPRRDLEERSTAPNMPSVTADALRVSQGGAARAQAEGSLERAGYARLVTHLFHSHASGILRLQRGDDHLTLYLLNGYPVWAEVPRAAALLDWLVQERVLLRGQVQHLYSLGSAPEIRAELLRSRIVSEDDMAPLMEGWLAWQVRRALSAGPGSYEFEETDEFAGMIPVYEVNPIRELAQALRDVPAAELAQDLDPLSGREIGRTRSFNRLFGYIGNTPDLRRLGEHLLRTRALDEVRRSFADDDSTRCLWLLVSAGLVAIADAPETSRGRPSHRRPTIPPRPGPSRPVRASQPGAGAPPGRAVASDRPPPPSMETRRYGRDIVDQVRKASARPAEDEDNPEARVALDYVTRMELDHYAFLGVARDADPQEIDAAYGALAPHYRLRNLGTEMHPDTRRQAKELLTKLVEAFGELSDPIARRLYDRGLAEAESVGRKPPGAKTNPGTTPPTPSEGPLSGYPSAASDQRLAELASALGAEPVKRWQQARRAMASGDHRRAFAALEELRVDLPSEPGLLADMAWCRFSMGIPTDARTQDKALEWVQLATAFRPGDPDVIDVHARVLALSDAHEEARTALERLHGSRPDLPWVGRELARHTELLGDGGEGTLFSGLFGRGRKK